MTARNRGRIVKPPKNRPYLSGISRSGDGTSRVALDAAFKPRFTESSQWLLVPSIEDKKALRSLPAL